MATGPRVEVHRHPLHWGSEGRKYSSVEGKASGKFLMKFQEDSANFYHPIMSLVGCHREISAPIGTLYASKVQRSQNSMCPALSVASSSEQSLL